ncbi:MAG: hypothetical protein U1F09_16315 [Steroidobacteraceae bacterium]
MNVLSVHEMCVQELVRADRGQELENLVVADVARPHVLSRSASVLSGDSIEPHGKPCAVSFHSCFVVDDAERRLVDADVVQALDVGMAATCTVAPSGRFWKSSTSPIAASTVNS